MKHLFKKAVKRIVDALLKVSDMPTYEEMRKTCNRLRNIEEKYNAMRFQCCLLLQSDNNVYVGHDECQRFENIQRLLRRSF